MFAVNIRCEMLDLYIHLEGQPLIIRWKHTFNSVMSPLTFRLATVRAYLDQFEMT